MKKLSLKALNRLSISEFKEIQKIPIIIVLDNIRSALNVGSAFRTADAFALQGICLCGITAQPPHREILKTAIGATDSMDWTYYENTAIAIEELKSQGYKIVGVEQAEESIMLQDVELVGDEKIALIFGNEVNGVGEEIMQMLDECVEVPQFGTKHSLNISVCLGVVVWEYFRKMKY